MMTNVKGTKSGSRKFRAYNNNKTNKKKLFEEHLLITKESGLVLIAAMLLRKYFKLLYQNV